MMAIWTPVIAFVYYTMLARNPEDEWVPDDPKQRRKGQRSPHDS